jgi:DMSO/TMAO reductase YedYZ molybdopterin-dependent catalytic subunit
MTDPAAPDGRPTLDVRTTDGPRIPPGQARTAKWPVLHYGDVPAVDLATWRLEVIGLVERPLRLTFDELRALPAQDTVCDIHCVTRWSRLDNRFTGVSVRRLLELAGARGRRAVRDGARRTGVHHQPRARGLDRPREPARLGARRRAARRRARRTAAAGGAAPLLLEEREVGARPRGPTQRRAGFWEQNGYHMRGDPWREERHTPSKFAQWMVNSLRNESKKRR